MYKAPGWAMRLRWAALAALVALPAHAQLMLNHAGHGGHGDDCVIKTGAFPVSVSVYEVPKGDLPPMHAFCDHVPEPGPLNITVDLSDAETREKSIALRLVKEDNGQEHEVMAVPAQQYGSGSIAVAVKLEELGQYALLLVTEDGGKANTAVRIPLHVGGDGGGHAGHGSGPGAMEIVLLLGAGGIAAYFWRRKKSDTTSS